MANEITIDVVARLDKIENQLNGLEKSSKDTSDKIEENLGSSLAKKITVGFAAVELALEGIKLAAEGITEIKNFLLESITEASQAEDSLNTFGASLRTVGQFSEENVSSFEAFAKSIQNVTTFSDDAIISASSYLVTIGRLSGEGLQVATQRATELAAGLNIDLNQAFELVAKAAAGNTDSLGRYGLKIDQNIPQNERFAALLNLIKTNFDGLAEAKVNTFAGSIAQLTNTFNDLKEEIGKIIINSPVLIAIIKEVATIFKEASLSITKFGTSGDIIGELIKNLLDFGQSVVTYVIAPLEFIGKIGVAAFNGLGFAIQSVLSLVDLLVGNILVLAGKFLDFASIAGDVAGVFNEDFGNKIKETLQNTGDDLKNLGVGFREVASEEFGASAEKAAQSFDDAFQPTISATLSNFINRFQTAANTTKKIAEDTGKTIKENLSEGITPPNTEGVEKKLLEFNQKFLAAQQARIGEELRIATQDNDRTVLFAEQKQLLEDQTQQKLAEIRHQYLDQGIIDQEQYRLISEQIIQTKNANVINLENQLNQKQIELGQSVSRTFQQGVANALATGIATIGASLVKGLKSFDNLQKKLFSIAGQLAIQIGTMILTTALATQALATGPFAAASAIPWAIGLIALGGVLSALGEGGGEGGGVVGQGAGGAGAAGGVSSFGGPSGPETQGFQAGTSVVVNVQGNVLDRRETGLELANIIRENFDTNAVSIPAGASI